jgi:5-methylcytosine-specific restriction protein A
VPRKSAHERGYGARWQRYTKWFLAGHPICQCTDCTVNGTIKAATDVDHVKPVSGPDDPLFWEPTNHQAMAHDCHARKTAREKAAGLLPRR